MAREKGEARAARLRDARGEGVIEGTQPAHREELLLLELQPLPLAPRVV